MSLIKYTSNNIFKNQNLRILISSFINLIFKMLLVFIIIDVFNANPEKSYIYILILILAFSIFSNLKIGFGYEFKLNYLIKWTIVMISILIFENFIFLYFQSMFDLKVYLSLLISIVLYIFRFFLQKKYIFK